MDYTLEKQAEIAKQLRLESLYYGIKSEDERKDKIKNLRWHIAHRHESERYGFYKSWGKECIKHFIKELRCADYTIAQERKSWVNAIVIGYQAASSGTSCDYQRKNCYKAY